MCGGETAYCEFNGFSACAQYVLSHSFILIICYCSKIERFLGSENVFVRVVRCYIAIASSNLQSTIALTVTATKLKNTLTLSLIHSTSWYFSFSFSVIRFVLRFDSVRLVHFENRWYCLVLSKPRENEIYCLFFIVGEHYSKQ